jgi:hypothetical protein
MKVNLEAILAWWVLGVAGSIDSKKSFKAFC